MRLGLGLNMLAAIQNSGGTPTPTPAVISSVNADGASVQPVTPAAAYFPDDPAQRVTFSTVEQGYDTSGNFQTNLSRTVTLTMRCRNNPYKFGNADDLNELEALTKLGTQTGRTAVSHWLFTTTSGNFTNNSAVVAPKPVAACLTPDHQMIRNDGSGHYYITLRWAAGSHGASGGRTAPYLRARATDTGANTTGWLAATWVDQFTDGIDCQAACGFELTLDLAALQDGTNNITIDWEVYPFLGSSASIRSTLDASRPRGVFPLTFSKSSSAATILYVASTGNDTTGNGTSGNPYLTPNKAINILGVTNSNGGFVYLMDSLAFGTGSVTSTSAQSSYVTIMKDPNTAGTVTLTMPGTNAGSNSKYIRFKDITWLRGGSWYYNNGSGTTIWWDNCVFDNNSGNLPFANQAMSFIFTGGSITRYQSSTFNNGAGNTLGLLMRGVQALTGNNTGNTIDIYIGVGNDFQGLHPGTSAASPPDYSGWILASNRFMGQGGTTDIIGMAGSATTLDGFLCMNNETEWVGSSSSIASVRISSDPPQSLNTYNGMFWNNTFAATYTAGRYNGQYDNNSASSGSGTVVRTHTVLDYRGNVFSQFNIKGGQFVGIDATDPTDAPLHIGNMALMYGTGFADNVYLYYDASGHNANGSYLNTFSQLYAGMNTYVGAVSVTRSDVWTTYAGVTYNGSTYTAGAGGSVLTVKNSSAPQYQRLTTLIVPKTLGGTTRTLPADAGARSTVN